MTENTFENLEEFYTGNPARRLSRELSYGAGWVTTSPPGTWRVSHLMDTREVYAMPTDKPGPVWVLGETADAGPPLEETIRGWEDRQGEPGGLHWLREQLARDANKERTAPEGPGEKARRADLLQQLNSAQRSAVVSVSGPLLIVAGPGSGKTRVITHRIGHMVTDMGIDPKHILAITFTRRAASEMRERLESILPQDHKDLSICTFHRLCAGILARHGALVGVQPRYSIYDLDKQKTLARQIQEHILSEIQEIKEQARRRNAGIAEDPGSPPIPENADMLLMHKQAVDAAKPDDVIRAISEAKAELVTWEQYPRWVAGKKMSEDDERQMGRDAAVPVYPRYERELRRNNAMDFDDMIMKTVQILERSRNVREEIHAQYTHIMVDEFQDTNHAQSALTRLITGEQQHLCVVGDPDQTVYGWRGADIRNIMEFQKEFPDAGTARLGENYRSSGLILKAADNLIRNNEGRIDNPLSTNNPPGAPIIVKRCKNDAEEANWAIGILEEMVERGDLHWKDTAVMYRTHTQSRPIENVCVRRRIPYRVFGGPRFYDREEIKDMLAYLQTLENPPDEISLRRIINKPSRGIGGGTVQKIAQHAGDNSCTMLQSIFTLSQDPRQAGDAGLRTQNEKAVIAFRDIMRELQEARDTMTVTGLMDRTLEITEMREHLRAKDDSSDDRWDNLMALRELTQPHGLSTSENGLNAFLENIVLTSAADHYDPDEGYLTLITLHQAKGLEFDAVAMPGMEDGKLPLARAENYEEERRLCYVGITRARKRLIMSWPERRGFISDPGGAGGARGLREESPFLREMGPEIQFLYRRGDRPWR